MNFKYYQSLVDDAKTQAKKELWEAEYGYPEGCPYNPRQLLDILDIIFDTAHNDINNLIARVGKVTDFARLYKRPYRTVQDWRSGNSKPSQCLINLIGYSLVQNQIKENQNRG